jgi:putative hemolysin
MRADPITARGGTVTFGSAFDPRGVRRSAALPDYPSAGGSIPRREIGGGSYTVRYATTPADLDLVLRLRYEVFNLELGEGLDDSPHTGKDEDELDARFHHLMIAAASGEVVGTYRMQTAEMAAASGGFYSEQEFDLSEFPTEVVAQAVEIGRACVARGHRNGRVLQLLWRGLAAYLSWNRKHYLFGCCSLTTQDPAVGIAAHRRLNRIGAVHPTLRAHPRPECRCHPLDPSRDQVAPAIPALFQTYLSLGAKVCGPPAIDRRFKTIDWLVILNTEAIDPATRKTYFR